MTREVKRWVLSVAACALLVAAPAFADDPPGPADQQARGGTVSQGPLVLERVKDGFIIAPEAKVTRFDGATRTLVGGYGGWLHDGRLLLGFGAYTLAEDSHSRDLTYGGLVVGYTAPLNNAVQVGVRGLFGGGESTTSDTVLVRVPYDGPHIMDQVHSLVWPDPTWRTVPARLRYRDSFVVAEPQAEIVVRLASWLAVTGSGGYRFVGGADRDSRLRGATGSISVRMGSGI